MAAVNDGDILRISAHMQLASAGAVDNVFTCRWNGLFSAADADVMIHIGNYMEEIYSEFSSIQVTSLTYETISAYNVTQDRPMPIIAWPSLVAGSSVGDPQPSGVAAFAFLRTGLPRTLARKFFGGLSDGAFVAGDIEPSVAVLFLAGLAVMLVPNLSLADNGTLTFGVVDKNGVFREVVDATIDTVPAYQRRRRRGRGQ
jgi:hypothetical protein